MSHPIEIYIQDCVMFISRVQCSDGLLSLFPHGFILTIIAIIFDSLVNKQFVHVKIAYSCSSVITLIADMSDISMNRFMFFQWILCIMFVATLITIKFYVCVHFLFVRLKAFSFKKYFPTFQTLKLFIAGDFQMSYLMLL